MANRKQIAHVTVFSWVREMRKRSDKLYALVRAEKVDWEENENEHFSVLLFHF